MIEQLKHEIELRIGRKVISRGDCELISKSILQKFDKTISYNTLRRLYNLEPYRNPNLSTLDILSQYIGFKDFIHFTENYSNKSKSDQFQKIYNLISQNSDSVEIINFLSKARVGSNYFLDILIILLRELFHLKKYNLINQIFLSKDITYELFSYDELLKLGNSVGFFLRKQDYIPNSLLVNVNFIKCIYLTFVDYSSLNGYYGTWAKKLTTSNLEGEIIVFSEAILQFKKYLNKEQVIPVSPDLIFSNQLNPILKSRLLALIFLSNSNYKFEFTLDDYYSQHANRFSVTDYSFELFTSCILSKNVDVMKFIIDKVDLNIKFFYQKSHLNYYYLMCAFYYKIVGEKILESINFNRFNLKNCRYSYVEYIEILFLIYKFNSVSSSEEKLNIKKRYKVLINKLKYQIFDSVFISNYFKKN